MVVIIYFVNNLFMYATIHLAYPIGFNMRNKMIYIHPCIN